MNATVVGSVGVSLLLLAFFLNLFRFLRTDGFLYMTLNLIGGGLACYSSYLISFPPFVVLEGTWAAVALAGIGRKIFRKEKPGMSSKQSPKSADPTLRQ